MKDIFPITICVLSLLSTTALSMDNPTPGQPLVLSKHSDIERTSQAILRSVAVQRARAAQHKARMAANAVIMTNLLTTACSLETYIAEIRAKNVAYLAATSLKIERWHQEDAQYEQEQERKRLAAQKVH